MIKEMVLDGLPLKYQITFKNNKNTYFYFKKEGYIQINASRYQTHKDIFSFIKKNKDSFIKKYETIQANIIDKDTYYLAGEKYSKETSDLVKCIEIDYLNHIVKEPNISIDQLTILYKIMEKEMLFNKLANLKEKYLNNGLVDINKVTFKTRYMQTRFGSCNPIKKAINVNLHLLKYDEKHLEYVFLHEIAHLVYQDHSKDYYMLLSKLSNNHKQLKKDLNNKFNYR